MIQIDSTEHQKVIDGIKEYMNINEFTNVNSLIGLINRQ